MAKYEHVILNTSRWESETIVEWLEYYIHIGFDHAYIYCNDDDPAPMYEKLRFYIESPLSFVTFHHMPYQGQQPACWMHFFENYRGECEWFMFVDADEFLAVKPHNSIKIFMNERKDRFDCIHFNWIWFGPEGFEQRPGGSTLLQYTHREDEKEQMNFFTKTITRSRYVDPNLIGRPPVDMLNHRWPATIAARLREANVLGENMQRFFSDFPRSAEDFMSDINRWKEVVDTACIYHFLFRSKKDFARRVERGTLGAYYFQPIWGRLSSKADEFEGFINRLNSLEDRYLADLWERRSKAISLRARATSLVEPNPTVNLARVSKPTQSSRSLWSKGASLEDDAVGAISGIHTGLDGFHTDLEDRPWWMTDLKDNYEIEQIRIFNSLKSAAFAARAYPLAVDTSVDGAEWLELFKNEHNSPFGGADGHPLVIDCKRTARYVRLKLMSRDFFHLDQVEIYGGMA